MFRSSGLHRLREDAGVGATVQAREHDAVALGVEKRDREGLIAAGVGERVEADHADLLDAPQSEPLELVMQPVQGLHPLGDRVESTELAVEELVQADALALTNEPAEPSAEQNVRPLQPRDPEDEHEDGDREHDDEGGKGLGIEGHSRRSIRGRVSSSSRGKETPRTRALPPGRRGVPPGLRRPSGGTRARAALTPGCHQPHDALWLAHGNLARLLADDTGPSGTHQRFIMQVSGSSQTLLIDNNVDIGKRAPVTTGDDVTVHGEYVWNDQGGLVHFTHHDPAHTHEDGWIELKAVRYS